MAFFSECSKVKRLLRRHGGVSKGGLLSEDFFGESGSKVKAFFRTGGGLNDLRRPILPIRRPRRNNGRAFERSVKCSIGSAIKGAFGPSILRSVIISVIDPIGGSFAYSVLIPSIIDANSEAPSAAKPSGGAVGPTATTGLQMTFSVSRGTACRFDGWHGRQGKVAL